MALTIIGIFLGTLAEGIGFVYWQRNPGWLGIAALFLGGLVGWWLTALLVAKSPASHPRRTNRVAWAIGYVFILAVLKVLLWLAWQWTIDHSDELIPRLKLTLATLVLLVGFHWKHALGIVAISGRSLQPTLWNPITGLATLSAAGGAAVWYATFHHGFDVHLALGMWLIYAFVENLLQFLAGGLFDPPAHAQSPFSIVTEVKREQAAAVKAFLKPFNGNPVAVRQQFEKYTRLHFCSFVLLEDPTGNTTLVFEGNIDGPALSFLESLAGRDRGFLDAVYAGSIGYPAANTSPREVADYLAEHDYGASAMYVGQPGATRDQIERDQKLRELIERELDANRATYAGMAPATCRTALQEFVITNPDFAWTREPVPTLLRMTLGPKLLYAALFGILLGIVDVSVSLASVDSVLTLILTLLTVIAGLAIVGMGYARWLRGREESDQENREVAPLGHLEELQAREDLQLQNHLVTIDEVKAGWLRLLTIRAVLVVIDQMARFVATRGNLSGIVTIHFARWVVLTRKGQPPRLLFLSNYDGTWENYLGEFVDRASNGLTAIWSNTQLEPNRGFPKTTWLFRTGGSRNEQWFKNYARLSGRTDLLWYSAYPALTMKHIANNREFRLGLFGPVGNVADWLQRL